MRIQVQLMNYLKADKFYLCNWYSNNGLPNEKSPAHYRTFFVFTCLYPGKSVNLFYLASIMKGALFLVSSIINFALGEVAMALIISY
jgi:hypothetical protein